MSEQSLVALFLYVFMRYGAEKMVSEHLKTQRGFNPIKNK
jgi:hypothetical protein